MKTLFYCSLLLLLARLGSGCKVPEYTYSYNSLIDSLRVDFKRKPELKLSIPTYQCWHVYQALYPVCGKINRHLEERTLENTLALDGICDGEIQTYHRFSLIVFDQVDDPSPSKDTVLLFSAHLKKFLDSTGVKNTTEQVTALGAVTLYIGSFKNDSTVQFSKRLVFTRPSNCKIPLFCFSRDGRLKGKPVDVNFEMFLQNHFSSNRTTPCQTNQIVVKRFIENDLNEISEDKPLVFNIQDVFKIPSMDFKALTCKCR